MLATVREHAREWLIEADELEVCREKHSAYYMRLAVTAERELRGPRQQEWLSRLVDEFNELRAAAEYLLSKERWDDAVNLVWPLYWFWWIGGRLTEVAGWMQQVVDRGADASERSKYIAQTEVLSIGLWRHPDPSIIGALKECAEFFHRDGDAFSESFALSGLGVLQLVSVPPDLDAAEDSLERAFAAADSLGDPFGSAMVGLMRGRVHLMRGNPAEAIKRLEEGLAFGRMTGDRLVISTALAERGWAAFLTGDMRRADECFREQLLISSTIGHEEGVGYGLEGLFSVAATAGDIGRGGLLLGAADSIRQRKGNSGATMVSFHLPVVKQVEDSPLAADFAAARATGREMDQAAAVELALS
jgi:tetratricopeptide (TPR) repeat protein